MTLPELINLLAKDSRCEVRARANPILADGNWPAEWRHLIENYERVSLFSKQERGTARNGWQFNLAQVPLFLNELTHLVSPPELDPFFARCLAIGHNCRDGADTIGLNLNSGPGFGRVFFTWMSKALGYRCPVIADSVTDWIELTYRAGPDSGYYFLRDDFINRGPLIPDDPEYKTVRSIFDP